MVRVRRECLVPPRTARSSRRKSTLCWHCSLPCLFQRSEFVRGVIIHNGRLTFPAAFFQLGDALLKRHYHVSQFLDAFLSHTKMLHRLATAWSLAGPETFQRQKVCTRKSSLQNGLGVSKLYGARQSGFSGGDRGDGGSPLRAQRILSNSVVVVRRN